MTKTVTSPYDVTEHLRTPEDSDIDEIMYRLYVLDKIRRGQETVEPGKTITSEDLRREIDSW